MKKFTRVLLPLFGIAWFGSIIIWIYGNYLERSDMSNAGFQIVGALGTGFFFIAIIAYLLIVGFKRLFRKDMFPKE